ncbi:THUMP [Macleaya cordata]|uniref:THUMP n=1 Tax=Macleaya cordata TaxID=56857 RepID=A0A200QMN2_MACCD|nr:THUMP [Macleaya cordata]
MAAENKPHSTNGNNGSKNKKRKQRYLPYNKSVKKGSYPLHPGVQGFFLTCDGGRERQATHEAINVIDTFYEELVDGDGLGKKCATAPSKPVNKITKFSDSDSSSDDDEGDDGKSEQHEEEDANNEHKKSEEDDTSAKKPRLETVESKCEDVVCDKTEEKSTEVASKCENVVCDKTEEKSIDKLIEAEIKELGDRSKRRFVSLDSGCNGCVFVQMPKRDGGPGPAEIVQYMMTSAASTRKHMSRFILRVLPVEVTCYASEEEISKTIKPLIAQYFPAEAPNSLKFAVLYEARANTGIDRMKIINTVAKSVPEPHKVDLNNPDKTIIVQICKTLCMIGVVEKYKELSKYNLRQLTSPKP